MKVTSLHLLAIILAMSSSTTTQAADAVAAMAPSKPLPSCTLPNGASRHNILCRPGEQGYEPGVELGDDESQPFAVYICNWLDNQHTTNVASGIYSSVFRQVAVAGFGSAAANAILKVNGCQVGIYPGKWSGTAPPAWKVRSDIMRYTTSTPIKRSDENRVVDLDLVYAQSMGVTTAGIVANIYTEPNESYSD